MSQWCRHSGTTRAVFCSPCRSESDNSGAHQSNGFALLVSFVEFHSKTCLEHYTLLGRHQAHAGRMAGCRLAHASIVAPPCAVPSKSVSGRANQRRASHLMVKRRSGAGEHGTGGKETNRQCSSQPRIAQQPSIFFCVCLPKRDWPETDKSRKRHGNTVACLLSDSCSR